MTGRRKSSLFFTRLVQHRVVVFTKRPTSDTPSTPGQWLSDRKVGGGGGLSHVDMLSYPWSNQCQLWHCQSNVGRTLFCSISGEIKCIFVCIIIVWNFVL